MELSFAGGKEDVIVNFNKDACCSVILSFSRGDKEITLPPFFGLSSELEAQKPQT